LLNAALQSLDELLEIFDGFAAGGEDEWIMEPRVLRARLVLAKARAAGRAPDVWVACTYGQQGEVLDRYPVWGAEQEARDDVATAAAADPVIARWTLTPLEEWLAAPVS